MIFGRSSRKKSRTGLALLREAGRAENEVPPIFGARAETLFVALAFVVILASVTEFPEFPRAAVIESGISEEVNAEIAFDAVDLAATKQARDLAAAKTPDVFRVDTARVQGQLNALDERIKKVLEADREGLAKEIRAALRASDSSQADTDIVWAATLKHAASLKERLGADSFSDSSALALWLLPSPDSLPKRVFAVKKGGGDAPVSSLTEPSPPPPDPGAKSHAAELTQLARQGLLYILSLGIASPDALNEEMRRSIAVVREQPVEDLKVSDTLILKDVPTPKEAVALLKDRITETARAVVGQSGDRLIDWGRMQVAAYEMARPFLKETLVFDKVYTEGERERARAAIEPIMKAVQLGETIKRSGEKWDDQSRSDVEAYHKALREQSKPALRILTILGAHAVLVALALSALLRSAKLLAVQREDVVRNVYLALMLMSGTLLLGRIVAHFDGTGFLVPVTAVAILLAILVDTRYAMMAGFLTSCLVSVQFSYSWHLLVVGSAMTLASTFGLYKVRRRSVMTNAALKATIVGALVVVAMILAGDPWRGGPVWLSVALVALNGLACVSLVPGLLSPLERLFKITTDIQLLEYSDLNNEVLKRMAIEIPATYAHSLMLGQLAESAADAIGANGLLARVCAYYHDIGKLRRPEYFSENQNGHNIHDDLPPRMSARAISSHVAYGLEIAREHHLPKPIMAGIAEHHGTSLISFFFQQAIEHHMRDDVREEDFRYPGPKPQSRETAILMICDAVESGVRSIKNPNEDRLRDFIDRIVMGRSSDHQFDDCGLTLKDLGTIKEVMAKRMATALHTRVAYPEAKAEPKADNIIPLTRGG